LIKLNSKNITVVLEIKSVIKYRFKITTKNNVNTRKLITEE